MSNSENAASPKGNESKCACGAPLVCVDTMSKFVAETNNKLLTILSGITDIRRQLRFSASFALPSARDEALKANLDRLSFESDELLNVVRILLNHPVRTGSLPCDYVGSL